MCIGSWVAQGFSWFHTSFVPSSAEGQAVQHSFSSTVGCSCFKLGKCSISKSLKQLYHRPFHSSTLGGWCGERPAFAFPYMGFSSVVSMGDGCV